jgi:glycosyltransferase involved in cell wall biosynthesis
MHMADGFSLVHVDTELEWRGGQEALLALARGLRERGHTQSIVCPKGSALADRARAEGLEVSSALRNVLHKSRAQILHAHGGRAQNTAFLASRGLAIRRVVTRHVAFAPRHPWVHRIKYQLTCHGIIAVSDAVREVLVRSGVPASKIEVIHTGIEIPTLPETRPHDDFVIGHMGAFTREKGQNVAIAAAVLLRKQLPQARMILAGDGPLLDEAREQARNIAVSCPGFLPNRELFYSGLDLFIMPSRSEAWGLAALEAMARGIPVIASNVGGLAEIVRHGDGGWLVPPNDPQALAAAIVEAASDEKRLNAAGQAARRRAAMFSLQHTVERTEAFYRRMLQATDE